MTADPIAAILPRITREKVEPHYTERVSAPWQKSPARPMIDWIVALDGERIGVFCGQTFQPDDRARFGGPVGFLSARRGRDGRIAAASPWACIRRQLAAIVNEEEALRPPAGGHPMTTPQIVARVIRMRAVALRAAGSWTRSKPDAPRPDPLHLPAPLRVRARGQDRILPADRARQQRPVACRAGHPEGWQDVRPAAGRRSDPDPRGRRERWR